MYRSVCCSVNSGVSVVYNGGIVISDYFSIFLGNLLTFSENIQTQTCPNRIQM